MNSFEYARPKTRDEVVQLLKASGDNARLLAGGTDLLNLMKEYIETPGLIIDIKGVEEMRGIRRDSSGQLRIGALVTLAELMKFEGIQSDYAVLWNAIEGLRSSQIHHMATVGGNLCQRPRCWYYRNGYGLLAMQNGESMVLKGDNRYHAILANNGPAYFVHPSSLAPGLIALGSRLKLLSAGGEREVPLKDFYRVPSSESEKEYDLAQGEIITEILVPSSPEQRKTDFYEVRQREALDWPLATAAVVLDMDGDQVQKAQIVLGKVAPIPWVASDAASSVQGKSISQDTAAAAGEAAVQGAKSLSKNAYKIPLARVAVKRALLRAAGMEV